MRTEIVERQQRDPFMRVQAKAHGSYLAVDQDNIGFEAWSHDEVKGGILR
jgi:hypothetical protein